MNQRSVQRDSDRRPQSGLASLLWPHLGSRPTPSTTRLTAESAADLDLEPIVRALTGGDADRRAFVLGILTDLCPDVEVLEYRTEILSNLLDDPHLCDRLADLLPVLTTVVRERPPPLFGYQWDVVQIIQRLKDLELYVEGCQRLEEALQSTHPRARGLGALRASVQALVTSADFVALSDELPGLSAHVDSIRSITIGVNLSEHLQPESATILSVDPDPVQGRSGLLNRLLGSDAAERGITPLRTGSGGPLQAFFPALQATSRTHENELVEDLRVLLERLAAPVGDVIQRYVWVQTRDLAVLEAELAFYLRAVALVRRLRSAGLPTTRAEPCALEARSCTLEGSYNISLALRLLDSKPSTAASDPTGIITNPILFDDVQGRVWILTGPNRGGKTTYTRSIGLAQILFQAGLYVPAERACMSPVDAIYTHFPGQETAVVGEGRLDDEAARLAGIFRRATPRSLILLNEVLSGTSTIEALALAHDAVRGLRLLGARAIYVTHLHELAMRTEQINGSTEGTARVASLVAGAEETGDRAAQHRRTFHIRPGPPLGFSYASEIAEQHGISYGQLMVLLEQRGVLPQGPNDQTKS